MSHPRIWLNNPSSSNLTLAAVCKRCRCQWSSDHIGERCFDMAPSECGGLIVSSTYYFKVRA